MSFKYGTLKFLVPELQVCFGQVMNSINHGLVNSDIEITTMKTIFRIIPLVQFITAYGKFGDYNPLDVALSLRNAF